MTGLTQTQRRTPSLLIASVALAATMLGGIGGFVGAQVQAMIQDANDAKVEEQAKWDAYGAEWERLHREQRGRYLSAHDQAVLDAAREWEARQREMYPN